MKKRIFKKKFKKLSTQLFTDGIIFGECYVEITKKNIRRLHPIKDSKIIESIFKDKNRAKKVL